ncbi:MAG: Zn-ribbon domain-containing OB-fold protein [Acidimicrobiales bacterium]
MKLLEPPESEHGRPFWDATRDERLLIPHSTETDRPFWFPREVAPDTLGTDIDWREASGHGVVYAVSVQHKAGPGRDPDEGPYAVALVDLPEGVRLMTNVVGCDPDDVTVGMAVRVAWHELSDGRKLPMFTPTQEA